MTLYRQLLIFTLSLCFVLFVGVWVDKLRSTRTFLSEQLQSHAQDTATSLGISLSPFIAKNDSAAVETMLNAIFDRGYYQRITLDDIYGVTIAERSIPIQIDSVPKWFIDSVSISAPGAQAYIMDGWNKAGTVYVESHPGYAYLTMWKTTVEITIYFILTGATILILGGIGLRILLRPLRLVERQADAICRREYETQKRIPRTRELARVVESMNTMTEKVREMFAEQAATAARLHKSAFGDSLTGLGNRRFIAAQVSAAMENGEEVVQGSFLLIKIHHLDEINTAKGYTAGDEFLREAAQLIGRLVAPTATHTAARLASADFAVFLPDIDREDSTRLAAQIAAELAGLTAEELSSSDHICSVGGAYYQSPLTFEQLLAEADSALSAAELAGPNQCHFVAVSPGSGNLPIRGKDWWRLALETALAQEALHLYAQQAVASDLTTPLHLELFCRINTEDGAIVPAGVFIPIAEQTGLVTKLDQKVIELVLKILPSMAGQPLAVNISASSIADEDFVSWLLKRLDEESRMTSRMLFEFPEFSALLHIETLRRFCRRVRERGHGIGIDHFGRSFGNFGYLRSLHPDYVKIDGAFSRELTAEHGDSNFFIGALCGVAHSLDIKVIAESVESEEQAMILKDLNVDGIQGYLISRPTALESR